MHNAKTPVDLGKLIFLLSENQLHPLGVQDERSSHELLKKFGLKDLRFSNGGVEIRWVNQKKTQKVRFGQKVSGLIFLRHRQMHCCLPRLSKLRMFSAHWQLETLFALTLALLTGIPASALSDPRDLGAKHNQQQSQWINPAPQASSPDNAVQATPLKPPTNDGGELQSAYDLFTRGNLAQAELRLQALARRPDGRQAGKILAEIYYIYCTRSAKNHDKSKAMQWCAEALSFNQGHDEAAAFIDAVLGEAKQHFMEGYILERSDRAKAVDHFTAVKKLLDPLKTDSRFNDFYIKADQHLSQLP